MLKIYLEILSKKKWGVQAFFRDSTGKTKSGVTDVVKIKGTSFFVIPEVSFGTIAMLLSMFGALGVYITAKRKA